jgi:hypothetical protein
VLAAFVLSSLVAFDDFEDLTRGGCVGKGVNKPTGCKCVLDHDALCLSKMDRLGSGLLVCGLDRHSLA